MNILKKIKDWILLPTNGETAKVCKYCKSEIDINAIICPNCRKKQPSRVKRIILVVIIAMLLLSMCSNSDDNTNTNTNTNTNKETNKSSSGSKLKHPNDSYKEEVTPLKDFSYEIKDNEIIFDNYNGINKYVRIPNSYTIKGKKYTIKKINGAMVLNSKVKIVVFSNGITEIENAFFNCSDVEKVFIPKSMNVIYDATLSYISSTLTDVYYEGSEKEWNKIYKTYKPESIKKELKDKDYSGAGGALADKINAAMRDGTELDNVKIHYNSSIKDVSK